MILCIKQDEHAQVPLAIAHTDLHALQERQGSVVQRIVDLDEMLFHAEEKKFRLKIDEGSCQP